MRSCSSRSASARPARSALQLGLAALLLVALAAVAGTLGAAGALDDVTGWHLVGGLGSAVYITAGIVLFPRLGAVVTVGLFVAGQVLISLALDGFGWLGIAAVPLDRPAVAGTVAVLAGIALIVRAQAAGPARHDWAALAFALAGGAVLPLQGAVNAQLRADLDAPVAAGGLRASPSCSPAWH